MKRTTLASFALVLAGTCLSSAFATEPALTFDCANVRVPRMADVSAVTGIDNFSHAYAAREMYLHQAQRLCRNPTVAIVRFVPESQVSVQPLRDVAAR